MSAEILRRAAALMRERATSARAGRWSADGAVVSADWEHAPRAITLCDGSPLREGNLANAAHIASWPPAVALAVADWLDACAEAWPASEPDYWSTARAEAIGHRQALNVARAYLGESA